MFAPSARRLWRAGLALLTVFAPGVAAHGQGAMDAFAPLAGPVPVAGQLHNAAAIAGFLAQLSPAGGRPLTIIQIGDSHTAGDALTNGWRRQWQAEYGVGGRGMSAVGRPYQGYLTWGVTARQSPDWHVNSIYGPSYAVDGPALGFSGFTQTAAHAGARVQLSADTPTFMFDHFALCGLTGPDKGAVTIQMGDVTRTASFAADLAGATCFDVDTPGLVAMVSVTTVDDRPVNLTSWDSRRMTGGVTLGNLGVVGSSFIHVARNNDVVAGTELRHARPDLVVLAFGTNEGFNASLKVADTEASMRAQIMRIRRLLGYAVPVLLLGPPDAASSHPDVALAGLPETAACGAGWSVPGHLAQMRQMELRLAQSMNLAFWDWQGAMGGTCASSRWVAQGLQRGDHVHFTTEGGQRLGEALATDLDTARANLVK
jgi:lysophospholipase L1-like esterase